MKLKTVAGVMFAGSAATLALLGSPAHAGNGGPGDDGSTQKGVVALDDTLPVQVCQSDIPVGGIGLVGVQVPVKVPIGSGNAGACANNGSSADS